MGDVGLMGMHVPGMSWREMREAVAWIERAASTARSSGSAKYLGRCHVLRGEQAIQGARWTDAAVELGQALAIGRRIEYPTLARQAASLLAQAQAAAADRRGDPDCAARRRHDRPGGVARSGAALRLACNGWSRVQTARIFR
jgi:hypothetical protein